MKKVKKQPVAKKPQLISVRKSLAPDRVMIIRVCLILSLVVLIIVPYLLWQLVNVQIIDKENYREEAISQQTRSKMLLPVRGTIYDASMNALAVTTVVEDICFAPSVMEQDQKLVICTYLADLLDMDCDVLLKKANNLKEGKKNFYEMVARDIEKERTDQLRAFIKKHRIKGVDFYPSGERYYPNGRFAASVIGFTDAEGAGTYGVEQYYDVILSGQPGRVISARNRDGESMPFAYEQYLDAQDGAGIVLTIDRDAQNILIKYLENATKSNSALGATGVVMRIQDGAIVATGHYPDYDLNSPRSLPESVERSIASLPEDKQSEARLKAYYTQWKNPVITEAYEPGSTFKTLTASMALEENDAKESDSFFCAGFTSVGGWDIHCWKRGGHDALNFTQGVMGSCNCVFMEVAQKIGYHNFYKYVGLFGLMNKTGVDLPGESSGFFFDEEAFGIGESNLAVASFGQRFKITPIQLITAVSGVANGGKMMRPHVVSAYTDNEGNISQTIEPVMTRQIVSQDTSKRICDILELVVSKGTGRNAYVPGYRVGGKTGTSEKFDAGDGAYIASFLGIAPSNDPQYACLVLIDEPGGASYQGGQIAAPVVGGIFSEILPALGVEPDNTGADADTIQVRVPKMTRKTVKEAEDIAKKSGLQVEIVGEGGVVTSQLPGYGSVISNRMPIVLYCGESVPDEQCQVPSVIGLSYSRAIKKMKEAGLYLRASGIVKTAAGEEMQARSQDITAGTGIKKGSVVTVTFLDVNTYNTGE